LSKRAPLIFERVWKDGQSKIKPGFWGIFSKLILLVDAVLNCLKEVEIIYYLAYGIMALMGVLVHPFFYAFHLTEIVIRYPTLTNVVRSVYQPRKALLLTFLLFLIIEYVFTLFGFAFLYQDYQGYCPSTWLCFLYTYDYTFKANGGIGGQLQEEAPGDYKVGRYIFDNLSNLILVIIMTNIVSGIIIDTFGSLREQEDDRECDTQDLCFICGYTRETFDRQADHKYGFMAHIKKDQYMWNYIFYMAHIKDKDETEYTGIESYVAEKIKTQDISWFPLGKASALKNLEDSEEQLQEAMINVFTTEVTDIKKSMKEINHYYTAISEKLSV